MTTVSHGSSLFKQPDKRNCSSPGWNQGLQLFSPTGERPICRKEAVLNFSRPLFQCRKKSEKRQSVSGVGTLTFPAGRLSRTKPEAPSAWEVHPRGLKKERKKEIDALLGAAAKACRQCIEPEQKAAYVSYSVQRSCLCTCTWSHNWGNSIWLVVFVKLPALVFLHFVKSLTLT